MSNNSFIERRFQRERSARKQAEQLLEKKSRDLYAANLELREMTENLERLVEKRTNELQVARDQAMAANRTKSSFLANVSHEIRTPMSSIIGVADLLLESPLSNNDRQHALLIADSARSLLTIINDILDLSKLESGKFQIHHEEFQLFELFDSALDMLGVEANNKHLEFGFIPEGKLPECVIGDPVRLRQILLNLLGNAIKFTERGEVKLIASAEDCGHNQMRLRVEVADSGPGISPEQQGKLFKKFNQLDDSLTRKRHGTGLGLAISKSLAESMGGEIGLHSKPGEGSSFWFTVMLGVPKANGTAANGLASGKNAVLLCSNQFILESVTAVLRSTGVKVTSTRDLKALEETLNETALQGEGIDLVIADMPSLCENQTIAGYREALKRYRVTNPALLTWLNCYECDDQGEWFRVINRPLTRHKLLEAILATRIPSPDIMVKRVEADGAKTKHILLAEDVKPLQLVAKAKLEKRGYSVDIANNGHEALNALRVNDYSMIFMDIQMPEMDGLTTTREIRSFSDPVKAKTPIIALTANAMKGDHELYLTEGMNDYLSKPIDDQQLDKVLERWATPAESS
ncbi:MAG: ATP-binding protein [Rhodothermales bacterium]